MGPDVSCRVHTCLHPEADPDSRQRCHITVRLSSHLRLGLPSDVMSSHQKAVCISLCFYACHMPCPSHIMKFLINQWSRALQLSVHLSLSEAKLHASAKNKIADNSLHIIISVFRNLGAIWAHVTGKAWNQPDSRQQTADSAQGAWNCLYTRFKTSIPQFRLLSYPKEKNSPSEVTTLSVSVSVSTSWRIFTKPVLTLCHWRLRLHREDKSKVPPLRTVELCRGEQRCSSTHS